MKRRIWSSNCLEIYTNSLVMLLDETNSRFCTASVWCWKRREMIHKLTRNNAVFGLFVWFSLWSRHSPRSKATVTSQNGKKQCTIYITNDSIFASLCFEVSRQFPWDTSARASIWQPLNKQLEGSVRRKFKKNNIW